MSASHLLVTGFGPFLGVERNPSGLLAESLDADPPPGLRVHGRVLPVSFAGVPGAWDAALAEMEGDAELLLAMGVHRGPSFRLERRARARVGGGRPDNDGDSAPLELEGGEYATGLDLDALARALSLAGAREVAISDDAGAYVCERTYHHVLRRADELGVPGLFLHVPPLDAVDFDEQLAVVRGFLPQLADAAR